MYFFLDGTPGTPRGAPGTPRGTPRTPSAQMAGTSPARPLMSSPLGKNIL